MHMTGLAFVYVVLPVMMAVFLLAPAAWRAGVLLALSLGYCLLAAPGYLPALAAGFAMDWAASLLMERYDDKPGVRRAAFGFSLIKNIGLILWYGFLWRSGALPETPLFIQVYALSSICFMLETFRREIPYEHSPVRFALYSCYFPRLVAGPLVSYSGFAPQLASLKPSFSQAGQGLGMFISGAVKVSVLATSLQILYGGFCAIPAADVTILKVLPGS